MTLKKSILSMLLVGCASGPQPVPTSATAADRLAHAEKALLSGKNMTATFELDSQGPNAAHLTGTLTFVDGNALHLVAEGNFKSEPVQVELDSRDKDAISRSTTRGASVSSHRDPPSSDVRRAVAISLARMGLLHDVVTLALDKPLEKINGGVEDWVKALDVKDGATESIDGQSCRRVDYVVQVAGEKSAESSTCIADATGLPVQRNMTVHFDEGDMTLVETYKWKLE